MLIDDILEALRKESIGLDEAMTQIRKRVADEGDDVQLQDLLDRVDRSQQAGLPSSQARQLRDALDNVFAEGGDATSGASSDASSDSGDDMLELSLEPVEEPERPKTLPPGEFDPEDLPVEDDSDSDTSQIGDRAENETAREPDPAPPETEPATPDAESESGLPPIHESESDTAPSPKTGETPTEGDTDGAQLPSGVGDSEADTDSGAEDDADRHEVIMETRSSIPSSEERDPSAAQPAGSNTTMIGALLGGRFELLARIGHDAYGTVYRARDHEATNRNPDDQFCGVRLLPSSLARRDEVVRRVQAIVKRFRRVQHPNILPAFSVERAEGQAWIVTQLPGGTTLARFIRRECVKGLPADRAMNIVTQIGAALQAAHKAGIPHGDLKPASIYIAADDSIQISDFGLRPALFGQQTPSGQAGSTEIEQMDPMDAYLTAETMEGSPPEPSDDVYALACIAVALLTGGHPFNGQSGLRRVERETRKPRIKQLTGHQNRVLDQALAVWRSERIQTVDEFLAELAKKRGKTPKLPFAVAAGIVLVVAAGWYPVQQWLAEREQQALINSLESRGWPGIRGDLRTLSEEDKASVLPELRSDLVSQYARTVETRLDDGQPLEAESLIREALRYYPDSERLTGLQERVVSARETLVENTVSSLQRKLDANELGDGEGQDDLPDLVLRLDRLAPQHPATDRETLRARYRERADVLASNGMREEIAAMATAAERLFPADDPIQNHLEESMAQAETRLAGEASSELTGRLEQRLPPANMDEMETIASDWIRLLHVTGSHPLLDQHQDAVDTTLNTRLQSLMSDNEWARANEFLREHAALWSTDALVSNRRELTRRALQNDYQPESLSEERNSLNEKRAEVEALLDAPRPTSVWRGELLIAWREMQGWMRPGRSWMPPLTERVETHFLEAVEAARDAGRSERAREMLATARDILPESRALQQAGN